MKMSFHEVQRINGPPVFSGLNPIPKVTAQNTRLTAFFQRNYRRSNFPNLQLKQKDKFVLQLSQYLLSPVWCNIKYVLGLFRDKLTLFKLPKVRKGSCGSIYRKRHPLFVFAVKKVQYSRYVDCTSCMCLIKDKRYQVRNQQSPI